MLVVFFRRQIGETFQAFGAFGQTVASAGAGTGLAIESIIGAPLRGLGGGLQGLLSPFGLATGPIPAPTYYQYPVYQPPVYQPQPQYQAPNQPPLTTKDSASDPTLTPKTRETQTKGQLVEIQKLAIAALKTETGAGHAERARAVIKATGFSPGKDFQATLPYLRSQGYTTKQAYDIWAQSDRYG
ncbi:MAG: hypothetical protein L0Y56_10675 [Nitrospira sp.]|nr:hypothetical protein [Nitrospira sp.]